MENLSLGLGEISAAYGALKEENQENEESGYPEKDSERKRKHNQGERGRETRGKGDEGVACAFGV